MRLDCKNLDCPQPVIKTKEAFEKLDNDEFLEVELNSYSSVENVKRFASKQGIYFEVKPKKDGMTLITLIKGYECGLEPAKSEKSFVTIITGSLISAFLASTCCLAPFLFLVFGVSMSSLSFLQFLAPYSIYFTLFSILLIGYLWYDYLQHRKEKLVCETWLSRNYKKLLIVGTIFVLVFTTYPYWIIYLLE
ncbi:MAG: sulfurtransferase TusA family protein [Campylobacteraceae bacterium]|nr:sulfurtransferase TusA family protein [Campylobacteraceae bacterium]